jgi:hypothetical protein
MENKSIGIAKGCFQLSSLGFRDRALLTISVDFIYADCSGKSRDSFGKSGSGETPQEQSDEEKEERKCLVQPRQALAG